MKKITIEEIKSRRKKFLDDTTSPAKFMSFIDMIRILKPNGPLKKIAKNQIISFEKALAIDLSFALVWLNGEPTDTYIHFDNYKKVLSQKNPDKQLQFKIHRLPTPIRNNEGVLRATMSDVLNYFSQKVEYLKNYLVRVN